MLSVPLTLFMIASAAGLMAPRAFRSVLNASSKQRSNLGMATTRTEEYSMPDQPARFAKGKEENNERMLNIEKIYDPSYLSGKTVLVTGGNRGIGLALVKELLQQKAKVIATCRDEKSITLPGMDAVIGGIDVTDDKCGELLASKLAGKKIDILINCAGYFYEKLETITSLNFEEEWKMINICALGPLRITSGLHNAGLLNTHAKVAMITSQGGSIQWRFTQNPKGYDYGHHMSKAAANMMGVLLSQELKEDGICVTLLHPGFNKTDMTKKYEAMWEIEGAVDASVGAKRVMHEIGLMDMSKSGKFINCEDGLLIPF